jgi:antitoxin ParD1/3/4
MNIALTPELERFVASKVASGRYHDAAEVVHEGLRLLEAQEQDQQSALTEAREKIEAGFEAARRGDLSDGDDFFDALEREDDTGERRTA